MWGSTPSNELSNDEYRAAVIQSGLIEGYTRILYLIFTSRSQECQNSMGKKKRSAPSKGFEETLAEVESIVEALESGELDLGESLEQYEKGVAQLRRCHSLLEDAQQRVSILAGFDADGNPVTEAMDAEETPSSGGPGLGQKHVDDLPGLF